MTLDFPFLIKLKDRYAALTLRERIIISAALLGVSWCLWLITLNDFVVGEVAEHSRLLREKEMELRTATEEQQLLRRARSQDPNEALRAEQAALEEALRALDQGMAHSLSRFVPPERMAELLKDLLNEHKGLGLKLVKRLPARALLPPAPPVPPGTTEASAAGSTPIAPSLYLHPLQLELTGRYFDVLAYLKTLETSSWRFNWRRFDYQTETYPLGRAVIEIETLSRDPRWLGV